MIHIVKKYNILYRAFSLKEDASIYINDKMKELHEHCCVCEECPGADYEEDNNHYNYRENWEVIDMQLDNHNQIEEFLFIVSNESGLDKVFITHEEAKAYIIEKEEIHNLRPDTFRILICKYRGKDEKHYWYGDNMDNCL